MPNPPVTLKCVSARPLPLRQTPNADGTYGGLYVGTEVITTTIWPEDSEVAVLTQVGSPNGWINAAQTTWAATLVDSQTATLTPGIYQIQMKAPPTGTSGETGVLFQGILEVTSSAGNVIPNNLASAIYVGKLLTQIKLASGEWEALPDVIAAASDLIRKWCNRLFTQSTYQEILPVINGYVLLSQVPVNAIIRAQTVPAQALTVGNTTAVSSWINVSFTGDASGFTGGPTITGINLNWLPGGPTGGQPVPFTTGMTIAQLATAINVVGNGWSATADSTYGLLPVTELIDLDSGAGSGASDPPYGGSVFNVYSEDIALRPDSDEGQKTGMYWAGRNRSGGDWGRWGYGWSIGDSGAAQSQVGQIRVTYNGGFAIIPTPVQAATAELVKGNFERLKTDAYLGSENAQEYSYTLAEELVGNLPKAVRESLSLYKIRNA